MSHKANEPSFAVFGFSERRPWTDRDGYDTDPADWGVTILLRGDGSANAYEMPDLAADWVIDDEPTLVGFWCRVDDGLSLEMKRVKKPDDRELPLPAGELYWYPTETETFFAEGKQVLKIVSDKQLLYGEQSFDRILGSLVIDLRK
jgi:hypothetical protein